MKYMGSKNRYAKELLPIILKHRKHGQCYVEPFVGGANMIDKVTGWRIGSDSHKYLIALLKALADGWVAPLEISEKLYGEIRLNKADYEAALVGFVGFPCSYAGKWFGGYCRGFTSNGKPRDYIKEAWRNAEKQKPNLKGINFVCSSYDDLEIPPRSIIYCDPPYAKTTKYKVKKDEFNYNEFWQWCREITDRGHDLFVSEYNAPADFVCLWEKEVNSSLTKNTGDKKGRERLFTHESRIGQV